MKLIIVLASEDYKTAIHNIFLRKHIAVFSEIEAKGFRTWNIEKEEGEKSKYRESHPIFSAMCFSFVSTSQAKGIIEEVKKFNQLQKLAKPIHAYELNVDSSTNVARI